ncbi:hypothetical protein [Actinomadura fibrosa]|uniref:DUF4175 domain-containing protein n=1 Tax=Actinomadura fibrosa TaxID=111802 RepID=A0ABW2XYZ9_9ACTN|nr:hypothetical protein [Actinomadura fibrosa]
MLGNLAAPVREAVSNSQDGMRISAGRSVLLVIFLLGLAGVVVLGVMAYTGRWHSWHDSTFFRWAYSPLSAAWFCAGVLWIALAYAIDWLMPGAPAIVYAWPIPLALTSAVISVLYFHPPRWMLPKWVRWKEGDASVPVRPASIDAHANSRVDAVMRVITLEFLQQ